MENEQREGKKEYRKPELVKRERIADVAEGVGPPIS